MSVVIVLILASLIVALLFLGGFIWAVRSGQYEDILTPAMRVLADESTAKEPISNAPHNGVPVALNSENPSQEIDRNI